jgi:hypothetical protein
MCATKEPCDGGVCASAGPAMPQARFSYRPGDRPRLIARISFSATGALDPSADGLTLELRGASGQMLYEASLPGQALQANQDRTVFPLPAMDSQPPSMDSQPPSDTESFQRLAVRVDQGRGAVRAVLASPALARLAEQDEEFSWVLRFGQTCLGSPPGLLDGLRSHITR